MSWLSNVVLPKIRSLVSKVDIPDNLWHKCPGCEQMIFNRELEDNLLVCPHCQHHLRAGAARRLAMLFDKGEYKQFEPVEPPMDPLKFKDTKKYPDRLKEARTKSGLQDAILIARGKLEGMDVVIGAFDFGFMGGSMGIYVGNAIIRACEEALKAKAPLILIPASGGSHAGRYPFTYADATNYPCLA